MSVDAKTLYQQQVLQHAKAPHNEGKLDPHSHQARGVNPLCGDRVTVYVNVEAGTITDIRFKAQSCAITKASASMMTELVKGQPLEVVQAISARAKEIVRPDAESPPAGDALEAFTGIRHFPTRTRCATLPWETLDEAIDG